MNRFLYLLTLVAVLAAGCSEPPEWKAERRKRNPVEAISPATALDMAVDDAVERMNGELAKDKKILWWAKPVALRVAERFRAKGWVVTLEPSHDGEMWVRFAWPENIK